MANDEHVEIIKQGTDAIAAFRKEHPEVEFDLSGAELSNTDLSNADLSYANMSHSNLSNARLFRANLSEADLSHCDLSYAKLSYADLRDAVLIHANLSFADLLCAALGDADLSHANMSETHLSFANLGACPLTGASLRNAMVGFTMFVDLNLADARDLESIVHMRPSSLDTHTLRASKGKIPESFLRGIGFTPWEVLNAKLYDPLLDAGQLAEIHDAMFKKLIGNPVGGVFISYSHTDIEFVEQLHAALDEEEYSVWRDDHDLVSGPLERQVFDAIRINDVVLLVLSQESVKSDWVEAELEKARDKEKNEGRPILCPIALDDAWKVKVEEEGRSVLWRHIKDNFVVDFSSQNTDGFDVAFAKLLRGLPRYYGEMEGAGAEGVATD